jgi:hypothetical protein
MYACFGETQEFGIGRHMEYEISVTVVREFAGRRGVDGAQRNGGGFKGV